MLKKLANLIAFQAAWFACILGAGNGLPWLGVPVVTGSAIVHLAFTRSRAQFSLLLLSAFVIGFVFDWAVMLLGAMSFPEHAHLLTPVPIWMPLMWVNLAIAIPYSLAWMKGRFALAVLFGLICGPGAYYTGMKLDAVQLGADLLPSILIIALEWAIAMPLLLCVADRAESISLSLRSRNTPSHGVTS